MSWTRALFRPSRVAVVGSCSPGKIGHVLITQLLDGGFGNVAAVNPRAQGIRGIPAARSFAELPDGSSAIDLAVIASPAATVPDVLEDAGKAGVKAAVIITAGFSESGNAEEERRLLAVARQSGIRLVGPNCAGIVNTKHSLFPTLETRPPSGDVAFISQSGALGGVVLSWAKEQGVGLSKFVSYGNAADLSEIDLLEYLREDDETQVVALYIETVSDGRRFMEAASKLTAVKPLIVIKSGRSESGGRATQSHTGSMAGSDAVYEAALSQCGAIRVAGIEEMFDLCRGFVHLPPMLGKRIAIVTNSGGPGVLAADAGDRAGLEIAPPSQDLHDRLAEQLPPFCSLTNPIDLTVQGTEDDYRETLIAALSEYDAAIAINVNTPYLDVAPLAHGVVAAAKKTDKPIVASFVAGQPAQAALPILAEGGVPNYVTGERAMRVLAALALRANHLLRGETPDGISPVEVTGTMT
ncbi:CoA-binding protein, partial [Candidatus Bipolaricaulota bacterium]|nr:CoA-binding protein [Candidatus Bipolaricaulota bacterium]